MSVPTRLCALGDGFATPSDASWGFEVFATDPDGYQWVFVAPSHHGPWWVWPLNRLAAF